MTDPMRVPGVTQPNAPRDNTTRLIVGIVLAALAVFVVAPAILVAMMMSPAVVISGTSHNSTVATFDK